MHHHTPPTKSFSIRANHPSKIVSVNQSKKNLSKKKKSLCHRKNNERDPLHIGNIDIGDCVWPMGFHHNSNHFVDCDRCITSALSHVRTWCSREFQIVSPASHHALRHLNIYIIHSTYSNAIKALECVNTQLALRARTQVPGNLAWKATLYLVGTVRGVCENFNHIPQISL